MASFGDILKKMFGSKAERDMKQIKPVLDKVLAAYSRIDSLSNDELRAEAERLKSVIRERIEEDETYEDFYAFLADLDNILGIGG